MDYFIVEANAGAARSERHKIAGPFRTVSHMVSALEEWLDERAEKPGSSQRYLWWIDQDGPEQHLVIEPKPADWVL
jgi:hypothetical protein